jgi:hypothetical protein
MRLSRRLKREKRDRSRKREVIDPLAPEYLADRLNPMKRIFPFEFPGQINDMTKQNGK